MRVIRSVLMMCVIAGGLDVLACGMTNPARHTNPDGSLGGFVSERAKVATTVHVDPGAKVCDSAWVEGNARILDSAVVKEQAWIRSFAIIRGRAVIAGRAYVEGIQNYPAIVEGNARVYGNGHILVGTTVTDNAVVYGSANIESSTVSENAEVCEDVRIDQETITDNYFCSEDGEISRINIVPETYKEGFVNKLAATVKFSARQYLFNRDASSFKVFINGNEVPSESVQISLSQISFTPGELQKEGWNTFRFEGIDQHQKKISTDDIRIFVGGSSKEIDINFENGSFEQQMKVEVIYRSLEDELRGLAKYHNGKLILEGLSEALDYYSVRLSAVGDQAFITENYSAIDQIPETLNAYSFPAFAVNDFSFEQGLAGWKISHSGNVSIVPESGKKGLEIVASESERVEVSKRFKLPKSIGALNFGVRLPVLSRVMRAQEGAIDIFIVALKDKSIISTSYNVASEEGFDKALTAFNKYGGTDVVFFLRAHPSLSLAKADESTRVDPPTPQGAAIIFKPYHFTPYNLPKKKKPQMSFSKSFNEEDVCEQKKTYQGNSQIAVYGGEGIDYFSVGDVFSMGPQLVHNRIHAELEIVNGFKANVADMYLVGEQGGIPKFQVSFKNSECGLQHFEALPNPGTSLTKRSLHPFGHTFSVPFSETMAPNVNPMIPITLYTMVALTDGTTIKSNKFYPKPLVSLPLVPEVTTFGGFDDYSSKGSGLARVGGDKWILPGYVAEVASLVEGTGWKVNDMSKANGGYFHPHARHQTGIDADISDGFNLALITGVTQWQSVLDRIESFILANEGMFHRLETLFLTRSQDAKGELSAIDVKYVMSRLDYRCLGSTVKRYVDMASALEEKTLLRDEKGHFDHLHFAFNPPDVLGIPQTRPIEPPGGVDIDSLEFSFNHDGELDIKPRSESNLDDVKVLWRYQEQPGFTNPDAGVQYGRWYKKSFDVETTGATIANEGIRYLHITFADMNTGGCFARTLELDLSNKMQSWKYQRGRNENAWKLVKVK